MMHQNLCLGRLLSRSGGSQANAQLPLRWFLLLAATYICAASPSAYGATYYVAKTGKSSHSCSQAKSASTPKLTIAAGLACLAAGDTLIIGSGTYAEGINDTIPTGKSNSAKTTVRSASGATVTLSPSRGIGPGSLHVIYITRSNITIDGLVIDGGKRVSLPFRWNGTNFGNVLKNSIVRNGASNCVTVQGNVTNATVLNNRIHSCNHHGIYPWNSGHIIERNEISAIKGMGIHLYKAAGGVSNNVIRYNYIHNNGSRGILLGSGNNNVAYHNTLVGNGFATKAGALAIASGPGGTNNQAYNNTLYANYQCINVSSKYRNSRVTNNLCVSNKSNVITNDGISTILANNKISTDASLAIDPVIAASSKIPSVPANLQATP